MMKQVILTILVCYLLSIKKGLGLVTFSDPPSGSVVANFKGTLNATTLTCNVSNNNSTGHQVTSVWTIKDFRNSSGRENITQVAPDLFYVDSDPNTQPGAKFGNRLMILNFTSELDSETVYCGTDANPEGANFTLRVYPPPSEPRAVMVKSLGATWIFITWEPRAPNKMEYPTISYEVRINNSHIDAGPLLLTTGNNETFINVTGLLPGTTYELTVVAVSRVGDAIARSGINASFVVKRTEVTVPALTCNATAVSINDSITVSWSYIHTGGLPLTNVSVRYSVTKPMSVVKPIALESINTTSVTVLDIETGFQYSFNITAENSNGSSSAVCKVDVGAIIGNNLGHSTNKAIAIIFGLLGGLFILVFLVTIVGFAIKRTLRKRDGVNRNYEPHFQQYSDYLLKQFTTIRQPKKHAFTDVYVYPSLVDPGNNSAEYSVHDL